MSLGLAWPFGRVAANSKVYEIAHSNIARPPSRLAWPVGSPVCPSLSLSHPYSVGSWNCAPVVPRHLLVAARPLGRPKLRVGAQTAGPDTDFRRASTINLNTNCSANLWRGWPVGQMVPIGEHLARQRTANWRLGTVASLQSPAEHEWAS